ncbi:hypothetical protein AAHE18_13G172100 [Arachis hypogaea]
MASISGICSSSYVLRLRNWNHSPTLTNPFRNGQELAAFLSRLKLGSDRALNIMSVAREVSLVTNDSAAAPIPMARLSACRIPTAKGFKKKKVLEKDPREL